MQRNYTGINADYFFLLLILLQNYPEDGLATVVRNVFDFDSYSAETQDSLVQVLHKHGIPIGASAKNLQLAKE